MTRGIGRAIIASAMLVGAIPVAAQVPQGRGGRGGPAPAPRASAPVDFTGNWVSVVSEDWRWRMITPPKGDYANIPLNAAARKIADAWDPARDETAGEQCKGYAAPAIMREPTRLRISWVDDYTLKIETDAGMQTRLLQFARPENPPSTVPAPAAAGQRSWQGVSVARWEPPPQGGRGLSLGLAPRAGTQGRSLEVVTNQIRPGYLRKNGVPFSENASVTEYFDLFPEPDGPDWFVVTTRVNDPVYLGEAWVTTSHFKKEPDASKWSPTPCQVR
jgi:hypothetical protein